ncbi:MAG TPA: glycosyltransferase family 4 protein [Candidatus Binatus sp.]|nr:glycosyltransferase family 4 protein [Candidatus Binatus sp.]
MSARRILFLEASTGGVVGGSLTGILPLIAHLDRSRFAPALALFEAKAIATNGMPVHVLPPLPVRAGAAQSGPLGRLVLRARNLYALTGPRARTLAGLFRRERPALVYLANGFRANLDGVVAAALCRVPVVCHVKGFEPVGPLERLTSRWIDACICMTDEIAAHCRARQLHARRLLTIHDGVDCEEFRPGGGDAIRREFGIPPGAPLAGIVGHLQEWKGQHLVLEAVARARRRFPELRCLIVGGVHRRGVEYAARLRERIAQPDLAGHVLLAGARQDVAACLDAMDVVIHASVVPEPFGRVLIEAMALARPVIAPREGGPLVVIVDGETGLLVPPRDAGALADALVALLADPARRAAMGRAGRARVEADFDIRHHVRAMETLFDEVLAARAGQGTT